jgi:hypothetical protein
MPWYVSKGNLFFSDLPCTDMSVTVICFSQMTDLPCPLHVSKGNLFFSDLPCPDMSVKIICFSQDMSGHGRSEKNKWPLLTCQGMEDLRKTNYLYWYVRAWKIWEKQMIFTDMSGHGRSEKNKLPLLTCNGHGRSVKVICVSQIFHALTCQ